MELKEGKENSMSQANKDPRVVAEQNGPSYSSVLPTSKGSKLTDVAARVSEWHLPFAVMSVGMIVMLLWAGSYKMTVPGADGIVPLVTNSPLISWHFRMFGSYIGSDLIGVTEWTAALLIAAGYFKPKAGIAGGLIATLMFFVTSTMLITTPGAIISVPGVPVMRYMSFLGLFLFKDVISLGVALYVISYFGTKTTTSENGKVGAGGVVGDSR